MFMVVVEAEAFRRRATMLTYFSMLLCMADAVDCNQLQRHQLELPSLCTVQIAPSVPDSQQYIEIQDYWIAAATETSCQGQDQSSWSITG